MKTPKQKARELVDKYLNASFNCKDCDMPYCDTKCVLLLDREAKECATILADEVIEDRSVRGQINFEYWKEVKKEIENL